MSYKTLNDAACHEPSLAPGDVEVWYMKPSHFGDLIMGYEWCQQQDMLPDSENLEATHILLGKVSGTNLEALWATLQGENWSPKAEAVDLIRSKGLQHTSMSVGDILVCPVKGKRKVHMADLTGFKELT